MPEFILTHKAGDVYGNLMLTGKSFVKKYSGGMRRFVEVICECGNIVFMAYSQLRMKKHPSISCGCKKKERLGKASITHGLSRCIELIPIYNSWKGMKSRCYNPNNPKYKDYGGRGIIVCDEWKDDFKAFYDWAISNGWEKGLTIDRYPNNETGIYEPSNCRWANDDQQSKNRRSNVLLIAFGETKCIADWADDERCTVAYSTLVARVKIGNVSHEMAITTPPQIHKKCPAQS